MAVPKITEKRISFGAGAKANVGNYQSIDVHWSESETWDVTLLDEDEVEKLVVTRTTEIENKIAEQVDKFLEENGKGFSK